MAEGANSSLVSVSKWVRSVKEKIHSGRQPVGDSPQCGGMVSCCW